VSTLALTRVECSVAAANLVHHGVGDVQFEALQAHDLLLERVARQHAVHVHRPLLAQPMRAVHGLRGTPHHITRCV